MAIAPISSTTAILAAASITARPRAENALDAAAQGSTLQALNSGRSGIDRIKAALTRLRDALQNARSTAAAVPGGTQFTPIVAHIEQTKDQPTFVAVNGQPVETGTVTVSLGTRAVIVGYEVGNRPSLAVQDAVGALASSVSQLVASVGGSTRAFAADVSALLKSRDLTTAVNSPDVASIDAALRQIDGVMAQAAGMSSALSSQASAAAQANRSGVLIGAGTASPLPVK